MKTVGSKLRETRESKGLLLRHVAAELDVDASYLSKIERGEKTPSKEHVKNLARILSMNERNLIIDYLSEKVVSELQEEESAIEIVQLVKKKLDSLNKDKNVKK